MCSLEVAAAGGSDRPYGPGRVDEAADPLPDTTGETVAPSSVAAYSVLDDAMERAPLPATLAQATVYPLGVPTVEPSIAVTADGTLFVTMPTSGAPRASLLLLPSRRPPLTGPDMR